MRLNKLNLRRFSDAVRIPTYDRNTLTPGIVHLSVGNFHRGHMAVYLDELFEQGEDLDWAVVGAGLRSSAVEMRETLKAQDYLTTVVELAPTAVSAHIVSSMVDFLPSDPNIIYDTLCDRQIRIVSMTITESGYYIDAATGEFAADHPEMVRDAKSPDSPVSLFGVIVKALKTRRDAGIDPFTILSCDNLPGNGNLTRQTVFGLACLGDPELAHWIAANVSFPNSMVDRIVPATTDRERRLVEDHFGIIDDLPVICEPFRQWVVEDHFPSGRPNLEKVGVEFVTDVSGYELMKLRILNAAHASMCYPALLLGHHFVHDAMADPDILQWLKTLLSQEAIPTLKPLPDVDYYQYLDKVLERFSNTEIGDTISRIAEEGSERQPKFILPAVLDALDAGKSVDGFALEIALWCRYCLGEDEQGKLINVKDLKASDLLKYSKASKTQSDAFLGNIDVFGSLGENSLFSEPFCYWLKYIHGQGVRAAIRKYVTKEK
jgi:mannitol 2-dehydrogenase|tara:strand:- start:2192 stop:3661 length:1470 start_codon:yes stop_codon:yes gene_type:complete